MRRAPTTHLGAAISEEARGNLDYFLKRACRRERAGGQALMHPDDPDHADPRCKPHHADHPN